MRHDTAVPIGSGGMGEVYKAWDPSLERWVALKYLRRAEPELVERLLREARAQARVDHPSVCRVYEVGEDEGRPFIAMQYVNGRPLDEAAAELGLEQKVLLVQKVAEAVQAAHAEGLIHRDLKPANILVAETADGLHPYVLDFGIARSQEVAGLTVTGQVLGTPGYLSPEQARGEHAAVDRRSDVFSLGVILYELLAGASPFSGDSSAEVLVSLLEHEPVPLTRVAPSLPRDLATVVMSCLEHEPERRYPSARALAEDLGRFLAGEPVAARPVSMAARLLRTARRHKVAAALVGSFAVLAVGLAAALVVSWVSYTAQLARERNAAVEARAAAEARQQEAQEVADFLVSIFKVSDPNVSRGESVTARELLDQGAERIRTSFPDQPLVRARLMHTMGAIYRRLGMLRPAEELLTEALAVREAELPEHSAEIAATLGTLGIVYATTGRQDQAEEVFRREVEISEAVLPADHPDLASAYNHLAILYGMQGRFDAAVALHQRSLALRRAALGADHLAVAQTLDNLAQVYNEMARYDEAVRLTREALAIREAQLDPDDLALAGNLDNLSGLLANLDQLAEAEQLGQRALAIRERILGPDHPDTATTLNTLGNVYRRLGRLAEAEHAYLRAIEIRRAVFGERHRRVTSCLSGLGKTYQAMGRLGDAEDSIRRALDVETEVLGATHPNTAYYRIDLGTVLLEQGRLDAAGEQFQAALELRESAFGSESFQLFYPLVHLAELRAKQERTAEGIALFERAFGLVAENGREADATSAGYLDDYLALLRIAGREADAAEVESRLRGGRAASEAE